MKNKKMIILICVALTITTTSNCLAAENSISSRQKKIEQAFMNRILVSQLQSASQIRLLEVAQTLKPNWADISEWADFAETVLKINGLEHEPFSLFKVTTKTPAERLAVALSRIAERKSGIMNRSKFDTLNLENQKEYALSAESAKLEKPSKEKALNLKTRVTNGQVEGIVYSPEKSSAVINTKIVHEGDVIQGVTVFKIYEDKVVFEKNGNRWEQAVRQTPNPSWN